MIMEFEEENSGNIPNGGIDEIIVSSNVMESDKYEGVANKLYHYGLINDEDFLTEAGRNYIKQLIDDANNLEKDKNAVCKNDYSKAKLNDVKKKIKEIMSKFDADIALDCGNKILLAINTILSIINACN